MNNNINMDSTIAGSWNTYYTTIMTENIQFGQYSHVFLQERIEDIKGLIRNRKSKISKG